VTSLFCVPKVKALKKIRHYVESHDKAIRRKAEIMVDHFIAQVAGKQKIGGKARAMIVRGFVEPIAKELPLEYAVEMNNLVNIELEGTMG